MSTTVNKYITTLEYTDKIFLVLSGANSGVSLCSFTTIIDIIIGIASASVSLVLLISNEIIKMLLKTF